MIGVGLILATSLALLNGTVRWVGGGDPNLLSPYFLREKCTALWLLAIHVARHPLRRGPAHPPIPPLVDRAARAHGIPRRLLTAVGRVESAWRPHSISRAGAMGTMQLMPATASELAVRDPFDSAQNIDGAARYLRRLWIRYRGDTRRVIAAYNAGPGRVPARGRLRGLPRETRTYVRRVVAAMR